MQRLNQILQGLETELAFASSGGYRLPVGWRPRFIFEDSPTCLKRRADACPCGKCVLMGFVPRQSCHERFPCRYIPLNECGETLETLYRTATNEEIEQCLRDWLRMKITQLKEEPQISARPNQAAA